MRSWHLVTLSSSVFCLALCILHSVLCTSEALGTISTKILQEGFEMRGPVWKRGRADAPVKVLAHELTGQHAWEGKRCEHIRALAGKGSFIHYTFDLPQAPVTDEFSLGLWLRSNRPGVQLLCRVVLPRERNPNQFDQPLTLLLRCEPYQNTSRWKRITLPQAVKRLREQQQLLTRQTGRDVITAGAYIDQLVLNIYDGPGEIDVWIDNLEVGPVLSDGGKGKGEDGRKTASPPPTGFRPPVFETSRRTGEVMLKNNQLLVGGEKFFLRGIRHTGTPLKTLRDAGFNTVWLDESTPSGLIEDAANLGLWIVPSLRPPHDPSGARRPGAGPVEGQLTSAESFHRKVARFLDQDAVLGWDLGSNLGAENFGDVRSFARTFRVSDPNRPLLADVWDGYRGYSRTVDQLLVGTHRWPLMTSLELTAYRDWLDMRRRLTVDNYCWTWVQTHLPDWYTRIAYDGAAPESLREPVGPQPEQIRLLAYAAIAAGYRGLAFWSDRFLADSHQGRDRLLAMALLNQELVLLERLLVQAREAPDWIPTSQPGVQAAVIRTPEGVLVLPIWLGKGAQYVPGQSATTELVLTVPGVPVTATAWEVSPGRIQSYKPHRELGGMQVRLRNFSLTSAVVFTSDHSKTGLLVWLQNQQRDMAPRAAQWLHGQAKEELAKVEKVQAALDRHAPSQPDAPALLKRARDALDRCVAHRGNREHNQAYADAEVALRAIRLLMRSHWERAVRDLDVPVSSPYAVSFYTLPKHWQLLDELRRRRPAASVLPGGGFEADAREVQQGWIVQEVPTLDSVTTPRVRRVDTAAKTGKQSLMMQVLPKDEKRPPAVLERTFVALHSPAVRLPPGTLVRISAWVKIPEALGASTDGALLYDSIGGEPLAVRLTGATDWKKYSLFRRVPASGTVNVTMALSGLGTVYFDDVRIEPLVPAGEVGRPGTDNGGRR